MVDKLDNLLLATHDGTVRFTGQHNLIIVTNPDQIFLLNEVTDSIIDMKGCKLIRLEKCRNIKIISDKLPIVGLYVSKSDNTIIDIGQKDIDTGAGNGYVSLDQSIKGVLSVAQSCTVEINNCTQIILNSVNISDQHIDSTWEISVL